MSPTLQPSKPTDTAKVKEDANSTLQLAQLAADGRLAATELFGGAADVAQTCYDTKRVQIFRTHLIKFWHICHNTIVLANDLILAYTLTTN